MRSPSSARILPNFVSQNGFFRRFFDRSANAAGIYCLVVIVGTCLAVQPSGKPPMMIIHSAKPLFA